MHVLKLQEGYCFYTKQYFFQLSDENYDEDVEQEDRVVYADILSVVGQFAIFCVDEFLPLIIS